jgi:DNA-binding transcriptional LysR family regulator
MFNQLPPLKALRAFEAAARHGSFTTAAGELSLTQGAISYQVRNLESKLGITLFQRSARQVTLTPQGQSLYRTTHRLFRELEDEIHKIAPGKDQLILTVSVSTYFVTRWLSKRLGHFLNNHPEVTIRLQHSVNDPDFTVEDVDLAIRWGNGNWQQGESELLIPSPMMAVCAPGLMPSKVELDDLRNQTFLHDQDSTVIDDPNVRVQSAIDGQGLVLANSLLSDDIAAGRLVEPFDIRLEGYGFHLLYEPAARRRNAFQLFRQWLLQEAEQFNRNNSPSD